MTVKQQTLFVALFVSVLSVAGFFPHALDLPVYQALRTFHNPLAEQIWDAVAYLGDGWVVVPVCLVLAGFGYWRRRECVQEISLRCLGAYTISGIAAQGFKHLLGRPRPRLIDEPSAQWGPSFVSGFDAFPSGHTTCAFALAAVLSHFYPRWRIVFFILACLVATARMVRGSHWVTDVVAGALLGTFVGMWMVTLQWDQRRLRTPTPPT
ncbi:MAG TPA: phosphatase PAP2 family protein [Nitrospirales bacterium]|nr:phosphatase PAP2 family protein [Nitrospirales bacterium]